MVIRKLRADRRRGINTVETAAVLVLLLSLMLGVFEFSRLLMAWDLLNNAAREGCRYAIANNTNSAVTANVGTGLQVQTQVPHFESATLRNCIFFGNGDDIVALGTLSASHCDSGDGALNAQPNCFSADPLFAKPLIGDYRLRFGSPCIDAGDGSSNGALWRE